MRALLESDGWTVIEAADGEAGLARARADKPDLMVLDVQMPKKDGFSVFADLAADPQGFAGKIVMLTGVRQKVGIGFSADDMGEFMGREPDAYVEKPIDPDAFQRIIAKVTGAA